MIKKYILIWVIQTTYWGSPVKFDEVCQCSQSVTTLQGFKYIETDTLQKTYTDSTSMSLFINKLKSDGRVTKITLKEKTTTTTEIK